MLNHNSILGCPHSFPIIDIPFFLEEDQQLKMALSWLVSSAKKSKSKISTSLAKELIQASTGQGDLIKKRNEIHKYANQNKVFAHYRWF